MERQSRNTTTGGVSNSRTFEDYDPAVEWRHAADADTATISLPGFRKEEVRVRVDSNGHLLVRGERPVEAGSSKWVRFSKDLMKLPDNCDTGGIRVAKLENSKLTITFPKKNHPCPPGSYALAPPPAAHEEEGKGRPLPSGDSASEPAPAVQEEKMSHSSSPDDCASEPVPAEQEQEKSRPSPPVSYALYALSPTPAPQKEGKGRPPSPSSGSASEPAPAVQEEKKSHPSSLDDSAFEPAPAGQEKSLPSPPDGSAAEPAPPSQEEKNSLPSPPDGYASEPAC